MTTISIIGSGNMATAIGTRAAQHGHTIEVISRNTAKAQALADQIGNGATQLASKHRQQCVLLLRSGSVIDIDQRPPVPFEDITRNMDTDGKGQT